MTRTLLGPLADDPVPVEDGEFELTTVVDVIAGGPGFVAIGNAPRGPVVWSSEDGVTWDRAPDDPDLDGGLAYAVRVGGPGLVMVGQDDEEAAVWISSDGVDWQRIRDPDLRTPVKTSPTGTYPTYMTDVASLADGSLLAVGVARFPGCGCGTRPGGRIGLLASSRRPDRSPAELDGPVLWRSADGIHWRRSAAAFPRGTGAERLVAFRDGWIGTSWGGDLLVSSDGRRARAVTPPFRYGTLTRDGRRLLAISKRDVWTSRDGARWIRTGPRLPSGFVGQSLAAVGDDLFALAYDLDSDGVALLASRGGGPWERSESPLLDGAWVERMAVADGRLALVGETPDPMERHLPAVWTVPPVDVSDSARSAPARTPWVAPGAVAWATLEGIQVPAWASTAAMPDGRILVAGGYSRLDGAPIREAWFLDPAGGSMTRAADLPADEEPPSVTVAPDGRVYLLADIGDSLALRISRWDPVDGTTEVVLDRLEGAQALSGEPWLADGRLLVRSAGDELLAIDPETGRTGPLPSPPTIRFGGLVTTVDGVTLLLTASRAWHLDRSTGWQPGTANPHLLERASPVSLADGRVAVLTRVHGPTCDEQVVTMLDIYDPGRGTWTTIGSLPQARDGFDVLQVPDGRLLILGGEHAYVEDPCTRPTEPMPSAILVEIPPGA